MSRQWNRLISKYSEKLEFIPTLFKKSERVNGIRKFGRCPSKDRAVYDAAYKNLAKVMINPNKPNKNKGEACSLAYAKATGIPVFATDEKDLQPIIDKQLNTGIDDITCIRIVDIIIKARDGEVDVPRKVAKALWIIAGKNKDIFDTEIWPVKAE